MIITITGTPGTGKTYVAKILAKKNKCKYIDLNKYIKENKLYHSYDKKADTYDVHVDKIKKLSFKEFKGGKIITKTDWEDFKIPKKSIIIDSHMSHYIPSDLCIVVKSDIGNIQKRLTKRKYSREKILENVQSEIFDICLEEATELDRKILIIYN